MEKIKDELAQYIVSNLPTNGLVALGAGSTVNKIIKYMGKLEAKPDIIAAASSTSQQLLLHSIPEIPLSQISFREIDLMVDGADHILSHNLILKGMGGAPAVEKTHWVASKKIIVAVDESKLIPVDKYIVPIEVFPLALPVLIKSIPKQIQSDSITLRTHPRMRMPFITDLGNYILDIKISELYINEIVDLHNILKNLTGVVETGIFHGELMKKAEIIVGYSDRIEKY